MKLVCVISSLSVGGAEHVLSFLANAYAARGHEVCILTLASQDVAPFYPLDARVQHIGLSQLQRENVGFLQRVIGMGRRIWALRKAIQQQKPDCVLSFVDIMNVTTLLATRGLAVASNVVVSERTDPHHHHVPRVYAWLRQWTYGWARAVVVQTPAAAAYFGLRLRSKIHEIPNAIQRPLGDVRLRDTPPRQIVSLGRLVASKGYDVLCAAFAKIAGAFPEVQLVIYGDGPERFALEAQIVELNLQGRISLPGTVIDTTSVLEAADVFAFPSRYEGFPNALLEAMSMGLPVLAAASSGAVAVIREGVNGCLVPVGDVAALAAALREILSDAALRDRFSARALEVRELFSSERILKLWDGVLCREDATMR